MKKWNVKDGDTLKSTYGKARRDDRVTAASLKWEAAQARRQNWLSHIIQTDTV